MSDDTPSPTQNPEFKRLESLALYNDQQYSDEEMQNINMLMTEVSLALLGNQFFDIHGQRHHTLEEVCRPDIKKRDSYNADNSDLMVYLSETQNNKVAKSSSEGVGSSKKSRPRTKPKPNESEDHEVKKHATKLVPQVGRIGNQRRNTVAGMRPNSNQLERQTKVFDKLVEQELREKQAVVERLRVEFFYQHYSSISEDKTAAHIMHEYHAEEERQLQADSNTLSILTRIILADEKNSRLREMEEIKIMENM